MRLGLESPQVSLLQYCFSKKQVQTQGKRNGLNVVHETKTRFLLEFEASCSSHRVVQKAKESLYKDSNTPDDYRGDRFAQKDLETWLNVQLIRGR